MREKPGVRLRASVASFGPILLAKVMELNETQESVLAMAFKYAEDRKMPLVDLADLRALLNHLNSDLGKKEMEAYGGVATATVGVMIRNIVGLEQQDADAFFGAPEFEVADFLRTTPEGAGIISVLELADMQDRPVLFSTFVLWLLARLYESLPEVGDLDQPKLVFFFDEAHLLFRDANKAFLQQIELVARLIRSKGVGVFFVTHAPADVPDEVLGQLGNRVQHALRAFTPDDLKVVKATAETFPLTEFYEVEQELTQLGIGEALVTGLSPKGVPMPTARTMMRPPMSLMAQLDPAALGAVVAASTIAAKYAADANPASAEEMLRPAAGAAAPPPGADPASTSRTRPRSRPAAPSAQPTRRSATTTSTGARSPRRARASPAAGPSTRSCAESCAASAAALIGQRPQPVPPRAAANHEEGEIGEDRGCRGRGPGLRGEAAGAGVVTTEDLLARGGKKSGRDPGRRHRDQREADPRVGQPRRPDADRWRRQRIRGPAGGGRCGLTCGARTAQRREPRDHLRRARRGPQHGSPHPLGEASWVGSPRPRRWTIWSSTETVGRLKHDGRAPRRPEINGDQESTAKEEK